MNRHKLLSLLEEKGFEIRLPEDLDANVPYTKIFPAKGHEKWAEWRNALDELNYEVVVDGECYIFVYEAGGNETKVGFEFYSRGGNFPLNIPLDTLWCNLMFSHSWSKGVRGKCRPFVLEGTVRRGSPDYEQRVVDKVMSLMDTKGDDLFKVFKTLLG